MNRPSNIPDAAGNPCGHLRQRSVRVTDFDEFGLIRAGSPRRCHSQHQSAIIGNNCRKGIHGRNAEAQRCGKG